MPRSRLSQRYNAQWLQENEHFDAEFCRLFWNPFAEPEPFEWPNGQPFKSSFKRKRARKRFRTATRNRHRCSICSTTFRWPADLKYHQAYQHRGEQLNVCPVAACGVNFQFPYQLANHQRTAGHHNWAVVCKECSKRFAHVRFLARHTVASCNRYKQKVANANEHYDDNVAT
ncbi:zinc finger protein 611-like [Anopheles marshallii]|uniref:zinc finger protein 611-like n=1 Tax=Anopheles marshallii TaxID=1521116 RepID=UPI00237BAAB8|nr:zinc finger protein 611-like [Anopheles marshallii]